MDSADASRLDAISTRWSLLAQARDGTAASAGEARKALVLRYMPAIRRYVGAVLQDNDADADDVTHDVVVRLLTGDFGGADPERGRFRNLLKVAVMNMVRNHWAKTKRRRGVDFDVAEVAADSDEDDQWTVQWRQSLLDTVWKALEQSQHEQSGSSAYTLMRLRAEHPEFTSEQLAAELAKTIGKPVRADAVRQKLRRARMQFVDLLLAEVARGLHDPTPEKIEEELVSLGLIDFLRDLLPADWKQG